MPNPLSPAQDASSDHDDRIKDFFSRHGGPSTQAATQGESMGGLQGWSEVYAKDGYKLRCDWSRMGTMQEMKYSEARAGGVDEPAGGSSTSG